MNTKLKCQQVSTVFVYGYWSSFVTWLCSGFQRFSNVQLSLGSRRDIAAMHHCGCKTKLADYVKSSLHCSFFVYLSPHLLKHKHDIQNRWQQTSELKNYTENRERYPPGLENTAKMCVYVCRVPEGAKQCFNLAQWSHVGARMRLESQGISDRHSMVGDTQ